jgi:nucleoside-diphosphate-sugar epimerase
MNVLIIGGTGLISTAITRFLVERGDDVTIYNRGKRTADVPSNIKRIQGDRKDYGAFEKQMSKLKHFDCVIDMVCFLPEDAESAIRAFTKRTEQYVFCSTVDVYTKPAKRYPITEVAEKQPNLSFPYALNKAKCERILFNAHQHGDINLTVIRPAYTYGEGAGIVHTFGWGTYLLDRIRRGKPVIIHGDGTSFWAACHRDDVGRAFANSAGNKKAFGKAYHLTGEEWMTWDRYHQVIAEAMGAPSPRLVHVPTDFLGKIAPQQAEWCVENFHFNNIYDNSAARADLWFRYTVPWVTGVRRVVNWLEQHDGIENSDVYLFYDRIIDAWEHLSENMKQELADLNL